MATTITIDTSGQNTTSGITSLGGPFYKERIKSTDMGIIDVIDRPKVEPLSQVMEQ